MKKMKRILVALLSCLTAFACVAGMSACSKEKKEESSKNNTPPTSESVAESNEPDSSSEAACVHIWNEGEVTTEPTCKEVGEKTYTCTLCEETKEESVSVDPEAHTVVTDAAVEATCTTAGKTEGSHCSVCEEVLVAQEEVPAAHTEVTDVAVAATCTATGLTEGSHCAVCEEVLVAQEEVAKAAHTEEDIPAVAATCTETGLTAGKKCTVCGTVTVAQEEVAATGHAYAVTTEKVEAKCEEAGAEAVETCANCGDVKGGAVINAIGHAYEVTTPAVEATCTTDSKLAVETCANCGSTKEVGTVVTAYGHKYVETEAAVAPTCTEAGKTNVQTCEYCGDVIASTPVAALGHTEEDLVVKAPTCTEAGLSAGKKCSVCGVVTVEQEEVVAAGHNYVETVITAATCDIDGLMKKVCSVCGDTVENVVIPKLGHDWDDANPVVVAATCVAAGEIKTYCKRDNCNLAEGDLRGYKVQPIAIDPNNHVAEAIVTLDAVAPTCVATGLTEGKKCTACDTITVAQEEVAATGNHIQTVVITPATCTTDGSISYDCNYCDYAKVDVLKAPGHAVKVLPAVEETCTTDGATKGEVCERCGEVLVAQEVIPAHGHVYTLKVVVNTCEDGSITGTCNYCGEYYNGSPEGQIIPGKGHDYKWTAGQLPSCDEWGFEGYYTCGKCNKLYDENYEEIEEVKYTLAPVGHVVDRWSAATCTEPRTCLECGEAVGRALGHNWGWIEIDPEAVKQYGFDLEKIVAYDEDGNYTWNELNYAAGEGYMPAIPADCTQTGCVAFTFCLRCFDLAKSYIQFSNNIFVQGNNVLGIKDIQDMLTFGILDENGKVCEEVSYDELEKVILAPLSENGEHTLVTVDGYQATCTEAGAYVYSYCSVDGCGYVIANVYDEKTDAVVEKEFFYGSFDKNLVVIPALGHDYTIELTNKYVPATCVTYSKSYFQCSRVNGDTACTEEKEVIGTEYDLVNGHNKVAKGDGHTPTCTEPGKYAYSQCSLCETYFVNVEDEEKAIASADFNAEEDLVAPATGHSFTVELEKKAPTCVAKGWTKYGCANENCEETWTDEDVAIDLVNGHNKVAKGDGHTPTCTEPGKYAYSQCSLCETYFVNVEDEEMAYPATEFSEEKLVAPATGHNFEGGKEVARTEATCQAAGSYTMECANGCKTTKDYEIAIKEHAKGALISTVEETCVATGLNTYACVYVAAGCTETFDEVIEIDEENKKHNYELIEEEATCCTVYKKYNKCTLCGEIVEIETGTEFDDTKHFNKLASQGRVCAATVVCDAKGCGAKFANPNPIDHTYNVLGNCQYCSAVYNGDVMNGKFYIFNADQLWAFAEKVNNGEYFADCEVILMNDVDLENVAWTPIGTTIAGAFQGDFNGNGKTVYNLNVTADAGAGFFGYVRGGVDRGITGSVKNLTIDGATVVGENYVGVIVGYSYGDITNCVVKNATVTANDAKAGAVVGYVGEDYIEGFSISGHTVENVEITADRDAGVIAGCVNFSYGLTVVENNTVTDVKVVWSGEGTGANLSQSWVGRVIDWEGEEIVVNNVNDLYFVAAIVNGTDGGNTLEGAVVELKADIDLDGYVWNPIGDMRTIIGYTEKGAPIMNSFAGTFNGNGYTISNLNVDVESYAGLFGCVFKGGEAASVNNVKVAGATIKAAHFAGVIAGHVYGNVTNCEVSDVTITLTPNEVAEGKYDNGDKAGAIIGYLGEGTYKVDGNKAVNVTIKGYRDIGGIVGCAQNADCVTNNTVEGTLSLTIDQVTNFYEAKDANAGAIVGRVNGGAVADSNVSVEPTITVVEAEVEEEVA